MDVFAMLLLALTGLALLIIGWLLIARQRIGLIHSYHHTRVRREDRPAYTRWMGLGCLMMGAGCLLCGLVNHFAHTAWGWALFAAGFLAGAWVMLRAQRRYNRVRPS